MSQLIKTYTQFQEGNYIKEMSNLSSSGQYKINAADITRERLQALKRGELELIRLWLDQYFHTPDGFAHPSENPEFFGRFKFVPDSDLLINIKDDAKITNGALELPDDETYAGIKGSEFVKVNSDGQTFALSAGKFTPNKNYKTEELYELGATPLGRRLGVAEVGDNKIDEIVNSDLWLAFLRGDKQLLMDYRNEVSAEMQRRNYKDKTLMGVYPGSGQVKPSMRAWAVDDLDGGSIAEGDGDLDLNARLVGVNSKIAEGDAQNLATRQEALSHIRKLEDLVKRF